MLLVFVSLSFHFSLLDLFVVLVAILKLTFRLLYLQVGLLITLVLSDNFERIVPKVRQGSCHS